MRGIRISNDVKTEGSYIGDPLDINQYATRRIRTAIIYRKSRTRIQHIPVRLPSMLLPSILTSPHVSMEVSNPAQFGICFQAVKRGHGILEAVEVPFLDPA